MPSMRIELISEDIYSFAEVISGYETSVLTVKLRGRIQAVWSSIRGVEVVENNYNRFGLPSLMTASQKPTRCTQMESTLSLYIAGTYILIARPGVQSVA